MPSTLTDMEQYKADSVGCAPFSAGPDFRSIVFPCVSNREDAPKAHLPRYFCNSGI